MQLFAGGLGGGLVLVVLVVITWPNVGAVAESEPESSAFIRRWNRFHAEPARHSWVPYSGISSNLKRAVLVSEDINFFSHNGFAVDEMRIAWREALEEKKLPRGASTITQQVAKNLWLSPARDPVRKIKEAVLTAQLERSVEKRRILELYLNFAEFGPGIYGAEAAARQYFGTGAGSLGEQSAAQLAAALPSPRRWHPGSGSRTAAWRTRLILQRMARASFLRREI